MVQLLFGYLGTGLVYGAFQLRYIYGLQQVIEGVKPDGLYGIMLVGGGKYDLKVEVAELLQQIEAGARLHFYVHKHYVRPQLGDHFLAFLYRVCHARHYDPGEVGL